MRHDHPTSFLIVDIDHFKKVNDQYGHSAGDNVLVDVSSIAQTVLRQENIWCRFGGEEFAVMLQETGGKEATAIAERLRCVIEKTRITTRNGLLKVTVSIGASERTPGRTHWGEVLEVADQALPRQNLQVVTVLFLQNRHYCQGRIQQYEINSPPLHQIRNARMCICAGVAPHEKT